MIAAVILAASLSLELQDDASRVPPLIEKLRSDQVEERERASTELKKLGKVAIPDLEKLASDKDLDLATRARGLVRWFRLQEIFGPEFRDLQDLPASMLVEWVEKKTGRKFLYTKSLGLQHIRVRLTDSLVDGGDAYTVGVALLRKADIAVIPSESVPGALELCPGPLGGKMALKIYKNVEDLPKADEFCTLILHPRHVSPRSVQAALINVMSFPQNCLSIEDAGTLVLSDYAPVLRKCGELVRGMDVSRTFRVQVALLEGRRGGEPSVPEAFRGLPLADATGLRRVTELGTASAKLERGVQSQMGVLPGPAGKTVLRFPGHTVEFGASVRASGGPTLERFTVLREGEKPLLEVTFAFKDENWTVVGSVPTAQEGVSLVVVARAVAE